MKHENKYKPAFTKKFRKWKTFCVVQPYSGTLYSIRISWICKAYSITLNVQKIKIKINKKKKKLPNNHNIFQFSTNPPIFNFNISVTLFVLQEIAYDYQNYTKLQNSQQIEETIFARRNQNPNPR